MGQVLKVSIVSGEKMESKSPSVIVLAGPNGAGKSTAAPALLKGKLGVTEFVDADVIAQGLSAFDPDTVAWSAGRLMLTRIKELARRRATFGFETTLASRSFAPWLRDLIQNGYLLHLVFLWLPSPDFAIDRVADRVRMGGHGVPDAIVRRRYSAGLRNFFGLYQPLATTWRMYDNSSPVAMRLIAAGKYASVTKLKDRAKWDKIKREYGNGK